MIGAQQGARGGANDQPVAVFGHGARDMPVASMRIRAMHEPPGGDPIPSDPYEVLHLHPKAHHLIVMRAFRVLAAMYHPDNKQTGDREQFEQIMSAYRLLSDPVRRAAHDRSQGRDTSAADGIEAAEESHRQSQAPDERRLRMLLLTTLYNARRNSLSKPGLSLRVLADVTDSDLDAVQFSLWYLRGKKLIEIGENDAMMITVAGVDYVEEHSGLGSEALLALPDGQGTRGCSDV